MRLIGVWESQKALLRFSQYLKSLSIDSKVMSHNDQFELWVIRDNDLEVARSEWELFITSPDDTRYRVRYTVKPSRDRALQSHYRRYFKRAHGNSLTITIIIISILVFILQNALWPGVINELLIVSPGKSIMQSWLTSPWRLLTPVFLHFSVLHILFNLYWLYDLGSLVEEKESRLFYIILMLGTALFSNVAQLFLSGPAFGGLSGVVYGLFGYLWFLSSYRPWSGYYVRSDIMYWLVGWLLLGFMGFLGPVANWSHLGGLLSGVVIAGIKSSGR